VPRNSRLLRAIELPDYQDIALASLIEKAMQFGSVPATSENGVPDGVKAAKTAQLIIPSSVALAVEHRTLHTVEDCAGSPRGSNNGNRTNCPRAAVQNLRPGFARSPRALAMSDDKAKTKKGNVKW
jgi:hypothetical protein